MVYVTARPKYTTGSLHGVGFPTLNRESSGYQEMVAKKKRVKAFCDNCRNLTPETSYRVAGLSGVVKYVYNPKENGACPRCGNYVFFSRIYKQEPDYMQKAALKSLKEHYKD